MGFLESVDRYSTRFLAYCVILIFSAFSEYPIFFPSSNSTFIARCISQRQRLQTFVALPTKSFTHLLVGWLPQSSYTYTQTAMPYSIEMLPTTSKT